MARKFWLAVGFLCLSLAPAAAQEGVLSELYGKGVHAYFANRPEVALEYFNTAIDNGSKDPRAYYFRGLTQLQLGDQWTADSDFGIAAALETADSNEFYDVSRALERIQGRQRLVIERFRTKGRLEALQRTRQLEYDRYERIRRTEPSVTIPPEEAPPVEAQPDEPAPEAEPAAPAVPPAAVPAEAPAADPFAEEPVETEPAMEEETIEPAGDEPPAVDEPAEEPAETETAPAAGEPAAEPEAVEPDATEPAATEPEATEPEAIEPDAAPAADEAAAPDEAMPAEEATEGATEEAPAEEPAEEAAPAKAAAYRQPAKRATDNPFGELLVRLALRSHIFNGPIQGR